MKIVFLGTPDFAQESLKAIYEAGHDVVLVVTNPDRPKGRGMKMVASPVKEYAVLNGLKIEQPERIKNNTEFIERVKSLKPDVLCVVAYGKILSKEILSIPTKGCINVHGSLLPKYRGAAPIQWAVINGDKITGVTTMYMNEGMDTGDMILKQDVEIGEDETTGELWNRLSKVGADLLIETLKQVEAGTAPRIPQSDDFTLAPMLSKEMARINWKTQSASQIKNLIRGLNPIMGAYTTLDGKKYKFWKVDTASIKDFEDKFKTYISINNSEFGKIIIANEKDGLYINSVNGIIKVLEIQGENSKRMDVKDFLRGNKLEEGKTFD